MGDESTLPSGAEPTHIERLGGHSHIRGQGLNENHDAAESFAHLSAKIALTQVPAITRNGPKPKPLQVSTNTRLGIKPRPLQLSTNTFYNQPLKTPQPSISEKKTTKTSNENHTKESVENAYDPLKDLYMFDEELYKKVCKLELADDGLPDFRIDEPFDF